MHYILSYLGASTPRPNEIIYMEIIIIHDCILTAKQSLHSG